MALALALSWVERFLPVGAALGIPGVRLGLSNVAVMFALYALNFPSALFIVIAKSALTAALSGVTAFFFSLSGGITALAVMFLLSRFPRAFSPLGVSIGGAAAHNAGQFAVAALTLGRLSVFTVLPPLLLLGLASGTLTGLVSLPLLTAGGGLYKYLPFRAK